MMSYTRLYVEPTEALMGQARRKRLLSLLKQRRENMRGYNSFFIIAISKDRKQSFKKAENKHSKRQTYGPKRNF